MNKTIVSLLGDGGHDHDLLLSKLKSVTDILAGQILSDVPPEELVPALAKKPDVLVLSKMNPHKNADGSQSDWMDPSREEKIIAYVAGGGSLLVWHSGLATFPAEGKFIAMLGGRFFHRPPEQLRVTYTPVAGTPMSPRFAAFEATDEHYQTVCDPSKTTVFLNSSSAEGQSPAGWYRTFGQGKICCLAAPHPSATNVVPQLEEILRLCLIWCSERAKGKVQ